MKRAVSMANRAEEVTGSTVVTPARKEPGWRGSRGRAIATGQAHRSRRREGAAEGTARLRRLTPGSVPDYLGPGGAFQGFRRASRQPNTRGAPTQLAVQRYN